MPEVILACPFCGNTSPRTTTKKDGVWCDKEECPNRQNTYAIDVWNALPRALTWTHEPPRVAGWYWCREYGCSIKLCVEVYGASNFLMFGSKRDDFNPQRPVTADGFEWAGPIPAPID